MKVLALDTSCPQGTVAIANDERVIAYLESDVTEKHSAKLLPLVDEALKKASLDIKDIDLYVVVTGPGSFTGLRIGLSVIKGFTFTDRKPIVTVSSLEALACSAPGVKKIAAIYDALRGSVFYGLYDTSGGLPVQLVKDKLLIKDEFLKTIDKETTVIGNGINVVADELTATGCKVSENIKIPCARDFVLLGIKNYKKKKNVVDTFSLEPVYLMGSAAEENQKK
jgi:tRNA threonylcarbamoyladenosine biosynthesis protein TsaB